MTKINTGSSVIQSGTSGKGTKPTGLPLRTAAKPEQQLKQFFKCLFNRSDLVEVRLLPSTKSEWHKRSELTDQYHRLKIENEHGENIYFGANPRNCEGRSTTDVKFARTLFADFDKTTLTAVLKLLSNTDLPHPTVIVNSGNGVHCYWRLRKPIRDLELWSKYQRRLIQLVGSDHKIHDPPRIMRAPGFKNTKYVPAVQAELVEANLQNCYELNQLVNALPFETKKRVEKQKTFIPINEHEEKAVHFCLNYKPAIAGEYGHDTAFYAARVVVHGLDLGIKTGLQILLSYYNPRCLPPWSEKELRHKCVDADRAPFDKPRGWFLELENQTEKSDFDVMDINQDLIVSDLWNARRLVKEHGKRIRYVPEWKCWIVWDGNRWDRDNDGEIIRCAKITIDRLQLSSTQPKDLPYE